MKKPVIPEEYNDFLENVESQTLRKRYNDKAEEMSKKILEVCGGEVRVVFAG